MTFNGRLKAESRGVARATVKLGRTENVCDLLTLSPRTAEQDTFR